MYNTTLQPRTHHRYFKPNTYLRIPPPLRLKFTRPMQIRLTGLPSLLHPNRLGCRHGSLWVCVGGRFVGRFRFVGRPRDVFGDGGSHGLEGREVHFAFVGGHFGVAV